MARQVKVLIVSTHPVQYAVPQFRLMAQHPMLNVQVAYCSLQGAKPGVDPGFGVQIAWDIPLLDGYSWVHVPNISLRPGLGRFLGLINPGLWKLVRTGGFDAVVVFTGYMYASFWIAAAAAKANGTAMLFGTDAHELRSRDSKRWRVSLKQRLWPRIFRLADIVIVPSSGGVALMQSLGIAPERTVLTPYSVDNDWWMQQAARVDVARIRQQWNIPEDASIVLFCAKLQPWKCPMDVLEAFAAADVSTSYLVFAGEGPMRPQLQTCARSLGAAERVRFLGFVNQSSLPAVYRASDVLVLPSEYEPFGVVVNEAMLCGLPVIVSDRVGARYDLVQEGKTGFVFPCGDVNTLISILQEALSDQGRLRRMGEAARQRMETWSPQQNVAALANAVERAVAFKQGQ